MSNLEIIRQKCIEANPDIVELRFVGMERAGGCSLHGYAAPSKDCGSCYKEVERPIRLADVLLALQKCDSNGALRTQNRAQWNLREDDLTKQSEETLAFLASLLS